jgi:predicted permease
LEAALRNLWLNVKYALRQFRLAPMFTASAVLTLALGIGGTTAIFTLIHAVMLRSLPVGDPAMLYRVGEGNGCCVRSSIQENWGVYSYDLYEQLKDATPEFESTTAFQAGDWRMSALRVGGETSPRPLSSEFVTGSYFSTLGVKAFGGRPITPEDDTPASPPVAVISHHIWQTAYGSDPSVVGSTFELEGHPVTIIGVMPPGFFGETLRANPTELWVPVQQEPMLDGRASLLHEKSEAWLRMIGRLRPGATTAGMDAKLTSVLRLWLQNDIAYPANYMPEVIRNLPKQFITVIPAGSGVATMKEDYGRSLQILFAVCGMVLLIACANVANLLLVRAFSRRSQTALRLAIGASGRQIIAQALTESVLLAVFGGIAGLLVAVGAAKLLLTLAFHSAHFLPISTAPSMPVLGFAFVVALLTGMLFGAAPAWFATRTDPAEALRGSGRSTKGQSSLARKALLVFQATVSIVLVAGAMMLARSLSNLEGQNFGYQLPNRITVTLHNPQSTRATEQMQATYRQIEARLSQIPGIEGASISMYNPLTDSWSENILVAGHPPCRVSSQCDSSWDRVGATFLQNLGMPIIRGRYFTDADNATSGNVAIVTEAFVKRFFRPDEEPIGQKFGMDLPENAESFRIVGIVGDAKFQGWALREPPMPMFFVPMQQSTNYSDANMRMMDVRSHQAGGILLVTRMSPGMIEPVVVKVLAELDPNVTVTSVRRLRQWVELRFNQERAVAGLATLFGIAALLLAAIGLYGVTAYSVAQRTNEIGIRMALGASRFGILQMVLLDAFGRVFAGLVLGVPLAIVAGHLIAAQLYGVSSWDPIALAAAGAALVVCSFVAAVIPANRAASISPMRALRTE